MDGVLDLPDDEVERDRMEGDFTRARMLRIWCFCSKPRCVCMVTRPVVALPDEDALNPLFAFLYGFVSLPLKILDAVNPHVSVQPVKEVLPSLSLESNELKKIPGSITVLEGLEEVNLSYNLFKRFPAAVTAVPKLRTLAVSGNQIRNISPKVGGMKQLVELRLDDNRIETLPAELGKCKSLVVLMLSKNAMTEFPEVVCGCTALKELWLEQNQLSSLPNRIDELSSLEVLALGTNAFSQMPRVLSQMPKLKDLRMGRNRVSSLMQSTTAKQQAALEASSGGKEVKFETFKMMVDLEHLHLGVNKLSSLPADVWKVPRLVELNLRSNMLTEISTEIERLSHCLEELYLDGNKLRELPAALEKCKRLKNLTVCDNQLTSLPALPQKLVQLLVRNNELTVRQHLQYWYWYCCHAYGGRHACVVWIGSAMAVRCSCRACCRRRRKV
jgi:Leucine-rich repeat (LRR) protein